MTKRTAHTGPGRKPDKLMRDAIILALKRESADGDGVLTKKLHLIADRLWKKQWAATSRRSRRSMTVWMEGQKTVQRRLEPGCGELGGVIPRPLNHAML